ncbi:MAG: Flp family type IVb pilin [Candidatus Puniceispirillum sp.]|nr:Flp family type IVb pilin [Candidatus Puniceispirillum sp.]
MSKIVKNFIVNEEGATAVEYGLLAALIAVVIIAAVTSVGQHLRSMFFNIANHL